MKYLNYILGGAVVVTLGVAAFFLKPVLGSTPYAGFTGVYNSSTITLRDGYGSALGTDENGYLLLSPSSTVGGGATLLSRLKAIFGLMEVLMQDLGSGPQALF